MNKIKKTVGVITNVITKVNTQGDIKDKETGDAIFKAVLFVSGIFVIILIMGFLITLFLSSLTAVKKFGFGFMVENAWNTRDDVYGALAFITGTLYSSFTALLISLPFSLSIGILLSQYLKKGFLSSFIKNATELLAGIPSVIYGFWGFLFLSPVVKWIAKTFFNMDIVGYGVLTSALVLSIMIIPYAASMTKEVLDLVPKDLQEAAFAMGATKFEVITKVALPYSFSGIFAGIILSLGRALGETMAVTMVIGNRNNIPSTIFDPANTIASVIANNFNESSGILTATLIELGFILMIITSTINFVGKYVIKKFNAKR